MSVAVHALSRRWVRSEPIRDQVNRAALSVALIIAEGRAADSDAEFRRFLGFSVRSVVEVIACMKVGMALGMVAADEADRMCATCDELEAKLRKLRNTLSASPRIKSRMLASRPDA